MRPIKKLLALPLALALSMPLAGIAGCDSNPNGPSMSGPAEGTPPAPAEVKPGTPPGGKGVRRGVAPSSVAAPPVD